MPPLSVRYLAVQLLVPICVAERKKKKGRKMNKVILYVTCCSLPLIYLQCMAYGILSRCQFYAGSNLRKKFFSIDAEVLLCDRPRSRTAALSLHTPHTHTNSMRSMRLSVLMQYAGRIVTWLARFDDFCIIDWSFAVTYSIMHCRRTNSRRMKRNR